jgi:hypothetical protein
MFGLYPAGPRWARRFMSTISAGKVRESLVEVAGFAVGTLVEPFGRDRGAVIASHQGFLVMVETDLEGVELIVVPDVQLQNLLWSMNSGYASQWSDREIKLLTGCDNWDDLVRDSSHKLKFIGSMVEQAVEGRLVKSQPVEKPESDQQSADTGSRGDESWIPSDYDYLVPVVDGDMSCVH